MNLKASDFETIFGDLNVSDSVTRERGTIKNKTPSLEHKILKWEPMLRLEYQDNRDLPTENSQVSQNFWKFNPIKLSLFNNQIYPISPYDLLLKSNLITLPDLYRSSEDRVENI